MSQKIDRFVLAGGGIGSRLQPRPTREKIMVPLGEGLAEEDKLPVLAFALGSMVSAGISKGTITVAYEDGEVQPWLDSIQDPGSYRDKPPFVRYWLDLCRAAEVSVIAQKQGDLEAYGTAVALEMGAHEGETVAYSTADEFVLDSKGHDGVMRSMVAALNQSGLPNAMAYRYVPDITTEDITSYGHMLGDSTLQGFAEKEEALALPRELLGKTNISRGIAGPTVIATSRSLVEAQRAQIARDGVRTSEAYVTTAFASAIPEGVLLTEAAGTYYDIGTHQAYAATDAAIGQIAANYQP